MTSTELQIKNIVYEEFSKLISNIEGDFKTNFVKKRYNFLLASVYKGIHIKTTKNGLPTY